jgi:hypothetical protein
VPFTASTTLAITAIIVWRACRFVYSSGSCHLRVARNSASRVLSTYLDTRPRRASERLLCNFGEGPSRLGTVRVRAFLKDVAAVPTPHLFLAVPAHRVRPRDMPRLSRGGPTNATSCHTCSSPLARCSPNRRFRSWACIPLPNSPWKGTARLTRNAQLWRPIPCSSARTGECPRKARRGSISD